MPFFEAAPPLQALGLGDADEAFWDAVRADLSAVPEARGWWRNVEGPLAPHIEEPELTNAAADLLPNHPWSRDTWSELTVRIAEATGRTGRELYRPHRLALNGRGDGPEMQDLLPLVGPDRAAARLRGRTA
jgi:glutamyl-tRNA synthetase